MSRSSDSDSQPQVKQDSKSITSLPFNVFTGTNTGYLKGVCFHKNVYYNLNSIESSSSNKSESLCCLCWGNTDESSVIAGRSNGSIFRYDISSGTISPVNIVSSLGDDKKLQAIKLHDSSLICAYKSGIVEIFDVADDTGLSNVSPSLTLNTWARREKQHLDCLDHNKSVPNRILTAGQENSLKVWDINSMDTQAPIFAAKNVRNDWLNLRCPVWFTRAKFFHSNNRIVSGTGYGQMRLYDLSGSQRRPVIEVKLGEKPLTGLCIMPQSDFQIVLGDTTGFLACVDLRKKAVVKCYKGCKGGVTDIEPHPKFPVFAVSSADRFVYCFDVDGSKKFINSMYLKHYVSCLLVSSSWHRDDYGPNASFGGVDSLSSKSEEADDSSGTDSDNEDELEDLWDSMEVVGSKRPKGPKVKSAKKSKCE